MGIMRPQVLADVISFNVDRTGGLVAESEEAGEVYPSSKK
jgi:hypothetical protein